MTESPATRVVLFDFGGVVIRTPFELLDSDWRGPFDTTTDPLWVQSQHGEITERDYWHQRASALHPDAEDPTFTFMRHLYEQSEDVVVRPELVRLLDDLEARGLQVAALTNDLTAFHPPDWIDRMTVIRRFDPLIDLSHVGFLKPASEAFEHALKVLDVAAADVVFLDDQKPNVAGAEAVGLRAVWFDPTRVEDSVERLLAEVGP